jgi:hypothetical protein
MNAPKLWLVQWTNTKYDNQVAVFSTKAEALAYIVDETLVSATPYNRSINVYRLGTTAPVRSLVGTWD